MKISIIAYPELYTDPKAFKIDKKTGDIELYSTEFISKQAHVREILEKLSGASANVCYTNKSMDEILAEKDSTTQKRLLNTIESGHHSVCDHPNLTLYLEDVPKLFAMLLNNEKDYATSEKSGRYANQNWSEDNKQDKLCLKWQKIVREKIDEAYKEDVLYLDDKRRNKLAQENGRYFASVLAPTTKMVHTLSWRQLNYQYNWMQEILEKENNPKLIEVLKPSMKDFCTQIESLGLVSEKLVDGKNRTFSLVSNKRVRENFDDTYQTSYKASFAQVAQAQRHRTIDHTISLPQNFEMYVPEILKNDNSLVKEYREDALKISDTYPQGMLVDTTESGNMDAFVWKMKERMCARAQNEIRLQTEITAKKYYESLKKVDEREAQSFSKYLNGSRCTFPNYTCREKCGWKDGITGERKI